MKMTKKIVALVSALAITASFAVTASAELGSATATASVDTVAAGEDVTIFAGWDTLLDAKGVQVTVEYDNTAFDVKAGENDAYNFGDFFAPAYEKAYIDDAYLAGLYEWKVNKKPVNFNVTYAFPGFSYDAVGNKVTYMWADTADKFVVASSYENAAVSKSVGTVFTAKDGIADGTYTFTCKVVVAYAGGAEVAKTATVDVTVGNGGNTGDDDTAEEMNAGVQVVGGLHDGKTSASTDVVAADELVKIVISNDVDTSTTLEWEAPKKLGGGKTNVLAVLLYDAADETLAGSTFTVKFLSADAVIKTFTHKVQ